MVKVSIIGATGYAGEELTRLLMEHPRAEVTEVVSKSFAGKRLSEVYANYHAEYDRPLSAMDLEAIGKKSDFVFLGLPHGASLECAPPLLEAGAKVIDLSGDFRYTDAKIYEEWYHIPHTQPELLAEAVYGMTELNAEKIKTARLVGNPGCYTTCSILALYPALKNALISPDDIVIDAKSGVTGAGRKESVNFSFCEVEGNFKAYNAVLHRHTSEIEEQLGKAAGQDITLLFTPHLLPVKRGILATCYTKLTPGTDAKAVEDAYHAFYDDKPFVEVLPMGTLPELKQVVGTNNVRIGFDISKRTNRLIVVSVLDNIIKGAGGSAVACFNLMNGFDETLGLPRLAWYL